MAPHTTSQTLLLLAIGTRHIDCSLVDRTGRLLSSGRSRSAGIQAGAVIEPREAHAAVVCAIVDAERAAGAQADGALVAISCGFSQLRRISGDVPLDPPIVTPQVASSLRKALIAHLERDGRVALHLEQGSFDLDGRHFDQAPIDRFGRVLELSLAAVTADSVPVRRVLETIEATDLSVIGVVPSGLATAVAVTTPAERQSGIAVVDVGYDQSMVTVYAGGRVTASGAVALGLDHLVGELAGATGLSLEKTERIILDHGIGVFAHAEHVDAALRLANGGLHSHVVPTLALPVSSNTTDARAPTCDVRLAALLRLVADRLDGADAALPPSSPVVLCGDGARIPGLGAHAAHIWARPVRLSHASAPVMSGLAIAANAPSIGMRFDAQRVGNLGHAGQGRHVA